MNRYRVEYIYTSYSDFILGSRLKSYDIYYADSARDAVEQCQDDFYLGNELEILSVEIWSLAGYWLPVDWS